MWFKGRTLTTNLFINETSWFIPKYPQKSTFFLKTLHLETSQNTTKSPTDGIENVLRTSSVFGKLTDWKNRAQRFNWCDAMCDVFSFMEFQGWNVAGNIPTMLPSNIPLRCASRKDCWMKIDIVNDGNEGRCLSWWLVMMREKVNDKNVNDLFFRYFFFFVDFVYFLRRDYFWWRISNKYSTFYTCGRQLISFFVFFFVAKHFIDLDYFY